MLITDLTGRIVLANRPAEALCLAMRQRNCSHCRSRILSRRVSVLPMSPSVYSLLGQLNDRHRWAVERRFGLNGQATTTLEKLASELGVTRERVRQIKMGALDSLRGMHLGMSRETV